jgi:pSer/pThr/pTyr-binding forkhead associated (FHA) protein
MEVSLVMFKSDGTRRDFPVRGQRMVLGRTNTCDLRIPLPSVSRKHCELLLKDQTLLLRDLGSSNGTFHNGSRVQQARVLPGDEIGIGPVRLTVVIDGKPAEITPPAPREKASESSPSEVIAELYDSQVPDDLGETSRHESPGAELPAPQPPAET